MLGVTSSDGLFNFFYHFKLYVMLKLHSLKGANRQPQVVRAFSTVNPSQLAQLSAVFKLESLEEKEAKTEYLNFMIT